MDKGYHSHAGKRQNMEDFCNLFQVPIPGREGEFTCQETPKSNPMRSPDDVNMINDGGDKGDDYAPHNETETRVVHSPVHNSPSKTSYHVMTVNAAVTIQGVFRLYRRCNAFKKSHNAKVAMALKLACQNAVVIQSLARRLLAKLKVSKIRQAQLYKAARTIQYFFLQAF